jgi:arginyl-tRNA--protein-N-Asp/Glu arginylyltransferase
MINTFKNEWIEFDYIRSQKMHSAVKAKFGKPLLQMALEDPLATEALCCALYECYLRACKLQGKEVKHSLDDFDLKLSDTEVYECINNMKVLGDVEEVGVN